MRDIFFIALIMTAIGFSACGIKSDSAVLDASEIKTTVKFVATELDLGRVNEGEKVAFVYELVNTGDADLLIHNVMVACGCTKPKYDKKPIRPGKKTSIEVTFDTAGRPGHQRKSVMIVTNTEPSNTVLTFNCEVLQ